MKRRGAEPGPEPEFAELLRTYRQATGLSQASLATRASMSVAAIRDLEQGRRRRPRPHSVRRLTAALGLNVSQGEALQHTAGKRPGPRDDAAARKPADALRLHVLGPLTAWRCQAEVDLGQPRQRAVLALLALQPGKPTHLESFIDLLWGASPPSTAVNVLQGYVCRLRQALDPHRAPREPGRLLVSAGVGYRLCPNADQLDLLAFGRLVTDARAARSSGEPGIACARYEEALALWRGEPAEGIDLLRGHSAVTELTRQKASVTAEYADVACGLGQYGRVLPGLRALARQDPFDEQVHARLIIALAGCGHQAAALRVYRELRRLLDEQLGVRPGAELEEAHLRVLRQNLPLPHAVTGPAPGMPPHRPAQPPETRPPRQCDAALADFFHQQRHWRDRAVTCRSALAAAQREGDPVSLARAHEHLGYVEAQLGSHQEATFHLWRAVSLFRQAGDQPSQAHAYLTLALTKGKEGCYDLALDCAKQSLRLYDGTEDGGGLADARSAVGWFHALLGDDHRALTYCDQALSGYLESGQLADAAATWENLAFVHHHVGRYRQALSCGQRALEIWSKLGGRYGRAVALSRLHAVHRAAGNTDEASEARAEALAILDEFDHPSADQMRNWLRLP